MRTRNPQMDELFKCRGNNAASPGHFWVRRRKIAVGRQRAELKMRIIRVTSEGGSSEKGKIGCSWGHGVFI